MNNVYLLSGSAETALGSSDQGLYPALMAGERAVGTIDRYDADSLSFSMAACIPFSRDEQQEGENLTQTLMRRVLNRLQPQLPPIATIIWAGVKGDVEFIEAGAWPGSLPHLPRHYSHWIRERLGVTKETTQVMEVGAACASSTQAIALGADLIASGRSQSVLIAAADIVSRFSLTGFNSLLALSGTQCRPFDLERDGLMLGDGAVAVLLAGEDYVKEVGLTPLARLTGWGAANDANHITAPARDGRGLISAVFLAMKKAGVGIDHIGAFCAHGTGTVYNDAMELTAVDAVFGDRRFPIFSIKGALGHTLGAAGGIETLVSARILTEDDVPPTTGFRQGEPRTEGRVSAEKQKTTKKCILTSNSGFGGVNAALILETV